MRSISHNIFQRSILEWYAKNRRDLPWRKTANPYKIWVSEIMLQQTQVDRVKAYYARFMKKFPTVRTLASASWEEVLDNWRGLGYYRRARNLYAAAKIVIKKYKGRFPQSLKELQSLPGIGSYTSAAIMSFSFGEDVPALDTNLHKVFRHILGEDFWIKLKPQEQFELVRSYFPKGKGALFNHALMDLGASGCVDKPEMHHLCPFRPRCRAPYKRIQRQPTGPKVYDTKVAIGILIHDQKILISRRRKDDTFGGFWEFPGGKVEAGEDERTCLKREMMEELGIEVAVRPSFYKVIAQHGEKKYFLHFHRCSLLLGTPRSIQVETFRWVSLPELKKFRFPPQNYKVIEMLKKKKGMFRYSG